MAQRHPVLLCDTGQSCVWERTAAEWISAYLPADPGKNKWLNPAQMLISLPRNPNLSCCQRSSEAHSVQTEKRAYLQAFPHDGGSTKTGGFCKRRLLCWFSPESARAAFPQQRRLAARAALPAKLYFSSPNQRWGARQETPREDSGMLWLQKARGWQPVPCPCRAAPSPSRDGQAPTESLQSVEALFPTPRADLKLFSLHGFLSPHQSHSCCMSAWGLDGSHAAMLLPPKYLLALLHGFAVVFPSAPNYTKTIY